MVHSNFERLQIYKLAERLADDIWSIVQPWQEFERETVGKSMIGSADRIGASLAEGDSLQNIDKNQHCLKMARMSLNQTRHWLRRAYYRQLLTIEQIEELKPTLEELSFRLNAYWEIFQQCFSPRK
jgi:four helix bundle protein